MHHLTTETTAHSEPTATSWLRSSHQFRLLGSTPFFGEAMIFVGRKQGVPVDVPSKQSLVSSFDPVPYSNLPSPSIAIIPLHPRPSLLSHPAPSPAASPALETATAPPGTPPAAGRDAPKTAPSDSQVENHPPNPPGKAPVGREDLLVF